GGSATGGAITEAYSLAFEAMELLLEGFDVALVEIDALAGIEPPAELRDRVNVGWVTLEIGLLYRDGLDALEKSFGTNLDDVMLTPAGRFALAEVCDLAASIPVPPPPIR
ncbi:MAG: hypothetical protein RLZZ01_428, partial [Actinomycetota bacterium]